MKARLAAAGVVTGRSSDRLPAAPTMVASSLSADCSAPQPLSLYCRVTVLSVVVNEDGDSVALFSDTQAEVTLTFTGDPTEAPVRLSVRLVWP